MLFARSSTASRRSASSSSFAPSIIAGTVPRSHENTKAAATVATTASAGNQVRRNMNPIVAF